KDVSVRTALDACFKDQPLTYVIVDKTIVVRLKQRPTVPIKMEELILPQAIVTGTVRDQKGDPLAGVTVRLKGTQTATTTDAEGNYSIVLPDENGTLVFSYIGYSKVEKPLNGSSKMDVVMSKSVSSLEELVTVGYGVQKKVNITGAVSKISGEQI